MHLVAAPLYPPAGSLVFNNYPPLGFYIVGAAGRFIFGDMIAAGRTISLAAMLACAALIQICVRRLGAEPQPATIAALAFLAVDLTFFHAYVGIDDPQFLAHALMLSGLAILLGPPSTLPEIHPEMPARRPLAPAVAPVIIAAALMTAGGLVKHNLVALPFATTIWLVLTNRHAARTFIVTATACLATAATLTWLAFGPDAFTDILSHRRIYHLALATHALKPLAPLIPMALAAGLALRSRRDKTTLLVALFAVIALLTGIAQRTGEGVANNAHFETLIALCIALGLALDHRTPRQPPVALFAILPALIAFPFHAPESWNRTLHATQNEAAWAPMIAQIATTPGPAACETIALCYWAKKPLTIDLFNLTQAARTGAPQTPLKTLAAAKTLALFEETPTSLIHRDAIRDVGHDPIMSAFETTYAPIATGPESTVLLGRK